MTKTASRGPAVQFSLKQCLSTPQQEQIQDPGGYPSKVLKT